MNMPTEPSPEVAPTQEPIRSCPKCGSLAVGYNHANGKPWCGRCGSLEADAPAVAPRETQTEEDIPEAPYYLDEHKNVVFTPTPTPVERDICPACTEVAKRNPGWFTYCPGTGICARPAAPTPVEPRCVRCNDTKVVPSAKRNEEGEPMELPCPEDMHFRAAPAESQGEPSCVDCGSPVSGHVKGSQCADPPISESQGVERAQPATRERRQKNDLFRRPAAAQPVEGPRCKHGKVTQGNAGDEGYVVMCDECGEDLSPTSHNLESRCVTEVNGAGVHREVWLECTKCHETFGEHDHVGHCPAAPVEGVERVTDDAPARVEPTCTYCGKPGELSAKGNWYVHQSTFDYQRCGHFFALATQPAKHTDARPADTIPEGLAYAISENRRLRTTISEQAALTVHAETRIEVLEAALREALEFLRSARDAFNANSTLNAELMVHHAIVLLAALAAPSGETKEKV